MKTFQAGLSRSVSKRRRWIVLGNPDNRRVTSFQSALRELGQPAADVVSYLDLLRGKIDLSETFTQFAGEPCVLRIESPGEEHDV